MKIYVIKYVTVCVMGASYVITSPIQTEKQHIDSIENLFELKILLFLYRPRHGYCYVCCPVMIVVKLLTCKIHKTGTDI